MFRMPRLTLFLAVAALAAAPSPAQAQPGGAAPSAQPARRVDECGKPGARARRGRTTPAAGVAAAAQPPRLLGTPVGGSAADNVAQAPAAGATGTAQGPRLLGTPVDEAAGSAAPGSHASAPMPGTDPQESSMATASAGHPHPASAAAGTAGGSNPQQGAQSTAAAAGGATPQASSTSATVPQASSTSVETAQSSTAAGSEFLSAGGDGPVDPRAAKRNRDALRLGLDDLGDRMRLGPAASVSVPTAFGVDAGELFFGIAYQGRTRYTREDDGAAVIGIGVGSRRVVALEAALTTYSTFRSNPLETGGVSVKLHRMLPRSTSVAVGYENAFLWGGSDDNGSLYAVATRMMNLREDPEAPLSTAVFTLGVGNGRFRFEDDDAEDNQTVNVFAAAGARVTPQVSLVADWTGQDLNAAASLTPLLRVPVVITIGLADLTGSAGDGARFILSLGYGLAFRQMF
jgi:hypothetical protein